MFRLRHTVFPLFKLRAFFKAVSALHMDWRSKLSRCEAIQAYFISRGWQNRRCKQFCV